MTFDGGASGRERLGEEPSLGAFCSRGVERAWLGVPAIEAPEELRLVAIGLCAGRLGDFGAEYR